MEQSFKMIKDYAESLGMTKDDILNAIKLFNHAKNHQVEFYIKSEGKISMRKIEKKPETTNPFGKNPFNNSKGDYFDNLFGSFKK